jgi:hypothetical protein
MMISLEEAFEESQRQIASGDATLEACLARYPQHADRLAQMLTASAHLERLPAARLSDSAKIRGRNQLRAHMAAHPRRQAPSRQRLSLFNPRRWAPALAVLALALTAGTAAAQSAGPGDWLYPWRQTSEAIWLQISPNQHAVALSVANRRLADLLQARPDSPAYIEALDAYQHWIRVMEADQLVDSQTQPALEQQRLQLQSSGIDTPEIDNALGGNPPSRQQATPTVLPSVTPSRSSPTTPPVLATPLVPGTGKQGEPTRGLPTLQLGPGGPRINQP